MVLSNVSQVLDCQRSLLDSNGSIIHFESLGVNWNDTSAQNQLLPIARGIVSGLYSKHYDPETQMVFFIDPKTNEKKAVFKPGAFRGEDEAFTRRLFHTAGVPDLAVPVMLYALDYFGLEAKKESLYDESIGSKKDPRSYPFAMEELLCGRKVDYICPSSKTDKKDTAFKLKGTLVGGLQPFLKKESLSFDQLSKVVILAALEGIQDFKGDALLGAFVDSEEAMAIPGYQNEDEDVPPTPTLHMPILGSDERLQKELTYEETQSLIMFVQDLNVDQLFHLAKTREFKFRPRELEQMACKADMDQERPQIFEIEKGVLSGCFSESGRDPEHFPSHPIGERALFSEWQVGAFKSRLSNLKDAFSSLNRFAESLPKMNIWGVIHIIDSAYKNFCEDVIEARRKKLSTPPTENAPKTLFRLDSQDRFFLESLAQSAGRVPYESLIVGGRVRERAASTPARPTSSASSSPKKPKNRSISLSEVDEKKEPPIFYFDPLANGASSSSSLSSLSLPGAEGKPN